MRFWNLAQYQCFIPVAVKFTHSAAAKVKIEAFSWISAKGRRTSAVPHGCVHGRPIWTVPFSHHARSIHYFPSPIPCLTQTTSNFFHLQHTTNMKTEFEKRIFLQNCNSVSSCATLSTSCILFSIGTCIPFSMHHWWAFSHDTCGRKLFDWYFDFRMRARAH